MNNTSKKKNKIVFYIIILILIVIIGLLIFTIIKDINDAKPIEIKEEPKETEVVKETLTTNINGYSIEIPNRLISLTTEDEEINLLGIENMYYDNAYNAIYAFNVLPNTSLNNIETAIRNNNYIINTKEINNLSFNYIEKNDGNIKTIIGYEKIEDNVTLLFYIFINNNTLIEDGIYLDVANVYKTATKEATAKEIITKEASDYLNVTPGMTIASKLY